jgi:hypothetical protein
VHEETAAGLAVERVDPAGAGAGRATHREAGHLRLVLVDDRLRGQPARPQVEQAREEYDQGRYTLWTGDIGVALYLRSCLEIDADFPTIDAW